ncbi:ParA family protein, partial [Clostridioides difficile]|nr:ParA family protein [Clostridioides difficile]
IISTEFKNVDVVPSATELSGAEIELTSKTNREYILKNSIKAVIDEYDYIFLDCPPSLGMLTINCLTAVDSVLIPIQCEYYALEGVSQLMETIKLVKSRLNADIEIQGVVLSMFDGRANLSIQVVEEVKKYFKGSVYTTLIPRNVRLAEAPSHGKPVIYYDKRCRGSVAYLELAEEFIDLEEEEW